MPSLCKAAIAAVASASVLLSAPTTEALRKPDPMILHSPYTPFGPLPEQDINVSHIPVLATQAASLGVNTVFISGSMSEFDTMTVAEREQLIAAWLHEAPAHKLYTIVNVGTTIKAHAKQLARFAASHGADAIAMVPPYYTLCGTVDCLVEWISDIAAEAGDLPIFYYHIPGTTRTTFAMGDLMRAADDAGLTRLTQDGGIKYVSTDLTDFLNVTTWVSEGHRNATILFAPEPKLQGFAIQHPYAGAVLAEDFYAPTYLRMRAAYDAGDYKGAIKEQNWKFAADAIFSQYGGTAAKRAAYKKMCGVDMGANRAPGVGFNESMYNALVTDLEGVGFWKQLKKP